MVLKFYRVIFIAPYMLLLSCQTQYDHAHNADQEVYNLIKESEKHVFNKQSNFNIDTKYSRQPIQSVTADSIRESAENSKAIALDLEQTLSYAASHSREFQTEKEQLYLSALNLSDAKHDYNLQGSSELGVHGELLPDGETRIRGRANNRISKLFKSGGRLTVNLANDLLKYFSGDPRTSASSVIRANILQPLLRGRGEAVAAENLTQAYRDMIYELRDYNYFQDTFSQGIVIAYLRLLQQKEQVSNEHNNYLSRKKDTEYLRARAVDRASPQEVSDSEQGELVAKTRYINALSRYQTSFDDFKFRIGMPVAYSLELKDSELTDIEKKGVINISISQQNAYQLALKYRLPLINAIDRFEDAKRKVVVAANNLKADVSFIGEISLPTTGNNIANFDFDRLSSSIGLELDLPVNKKRERNAYRRSLISFESSARSLSREFNSLKNLVSLRYRELEQFKQNYAIQKNALSLAEQRVEGNKLLLKAGKVIFRRLSESQDALILSQNAVTDALVDYLQARLNLYNDIGILNTSRKQYWVENRPFKFK